MHERPPRAFHGASPSRRDILELAPVRGQVTMFPTTITSTHATSAVTPKAAFCVRVSFRSAASYQMIELTTATAKRARINNFICDQSLNDPGAPNGAIASLLPIYVSKIRNASARRRKAVYPAVRHSPSTKARRVRGRAKKDLKRANEMCGYSPCKGAW
jgi:hypothetical protein